MSLKKITQIALALVTNKFLSKPDEVAVGGPPAVAVPKDGRPHPQPEAELQEEGGQGVLGAFVKKYKYIIGPE